MPVPAAPDTHHIALQGIGVLGSLIYVGGYLLVQTGHICGNRAAFMLSKLLAAICVLASLASAFNLAAFLIQISFIAISLFGLWHRMTGRFAARHVRRVHVHSMRRTCLADEGAWMPGEGARSISPLVLPASPGRRGHRAQARWPRQKRGM